MSSEERSDVQPPHPTRIEDDIHFFLLNTQNTLFAREWNRRTIKLIVLVLHTVSDRDPDPPLYELLHPDPHSGV